MSTCDTCQHWRPALGDKLLRAGFHGECMHFSDVKDDELDDDFEDDAAIIFVSPSPNTFYDASLITKRDFGCTEHRPR